MRFQYILHDAGWATAIISCDNQSIEMSVSSLHDTLKDLASAAITIFNGENEAAVIFLDEPGEHQLLINRLENKSELFLEIRWYDDWQSWGLGTSDYKVVLSCTTEPTHLCGQVISVLEDIFEEYGEAGYKEQWGEHEFPIEQLRKLQA